MKHEWFPMSYHKEYGCWLLVKDDCGYPMHCGESFLLCIDGDRGVPCRLELGRQWYVVVGSEGVKLNLRTNEIYNIAI
ncbi:DUF5348 domain-containing protein [Cytobacillus firmus]|jgi:hypothetical protein|uniref:DUF5348 domain-containing protein n=1 Tax=Cytobacillus firmus TaxID=1399 RepID=UPI0018CE7C45|nr:DUF5348 domain-containing protein [Cytobacillus firmus]MBG9654260.1 hypothetical protein [Cytobacillus firmus]MBG9656575.1 hypothetical protein [Cytobacillus firmus]MBG9656653.1 hypothetical protein [Cytobacillus firmus]MBG9656687.1 hypothetical protein [Cytobacillus firmus]MED1907462.1 DUF5348 domain-containing protein [Cytobacillus firmus]